MELSAALTADINDLCTSVASDPHTVTDPLRALNRDLRLTTRSYLGLQLELLDHGRTVTLTSFEPGVQFEDIVSSLHLPLTMLAPGATARSPAAVEALDEASALTLYAGRPGALVDLAADLTYGLAPGHPGPSRSKAAGGLGSPAGEVSLDQHLTPRSLVAGVAGAGDVSTVNRAVGLLIGQGQTPEEARHDLTTQAGIAGVTVAAWSAELLKPVAPATP